MELSDVRVLFIGTPKGFVSKSLKVLESSKMKFKEKVFDDKVISMIKKMAPQAIFLDLYSKEYDSFEFCEMLKSDVETAQILLFYVIDAKDVFVKYSCLNAGADDVLEVPVNRIILEKKIKSLLKLTGVKANEETSKVGFFLSSKKYCAVLNGKEIKIPKKEFEFLQLLHEMPDRVFTNEEILNKIWKSKNIIVTNKVIPVYVKKIRTRIGYDFIKSHKGVGYSFNSHANILENEQE